MRYLLLALCLLAAGCATVTEARERPRLFDGAIAASLGKARIAVRNLPVIRRIARAECKTCNATGRVPTGDGLAYAECQNCEPPAVAQENAAIGEIVTSKLTGTADCGDACLCCAACPCGKDKAPVAKKPAAKPKPVAKKPATNKPGDVVCTENGCYRVPAGSYSRPNLSRRGIFLRGR